MIKKLLTLLFSLITLCLPYPVLAQSAQISSSFSPPSVSGALNADVVTEIKLTPSQNITAQVYTINASFDTSKLEIKDITYLVGSKSSNLGGDGNSNIAEINSRSSPAVLKLFGEVLDPAGFSVTGNQPTSFVRLTFTVKDSAQTTVNIQGSSSIVIVLANTSLQTLPLTTSTLTVNPTGVPPASLTKFFRISENPNDFTTFSQSDQTGWQPYSSHPLSLTYTLSSPLRNNDVRTIYVQFQSATGTNSQVFRKNIKYSADPRILNLDCHQASSGVGTAIIIRGANFGPKGSSGKVKIGANEVDVSSWDDQTDTITLSLNQRLEGRSPVSVTIDDGRTVSANCTIDTTIIEFGTRTQCKLPGLFAANNVDLKVFEAVAGSLNPEPIQRQRISLDREGNPSGFAQKFEKGKNYQLIIKAPGTLARRASFKAEGGTTILDPISFPVGDIAPATSPDGKINAVDVSELKRQWNLITDVQRTGDLNGDSRVNSIDYSCLRLNFNESDQGYSPPAVLPSPSNIGTGGT